MQFLLKISAALSITLGLMTVPAVAQGPFDGHWTFDATGAGHFDANQRYQCPPIHLNLMVTNGAISGSIEPHDGYVQQVTDGTDSSAIPITGTIGDDGKVVMKWADQVATGTAGKHGLEVSWNDECGQRIGDARPE
jgi:hypothetical protein